MDKIGISIYENNQIFTKKIILLFIILISFLIYFIKNNISKYLTKRQKLKELSEDYEKKRKYRFDLAYHYFWQLDSGEHVAAGRTSIEILELDEELLEIYENYQELKKNGSVDIKHIK